MLTRHSPVRHPRSGMTLIELMVALVITGITLAAGYSALSTVIDRRLQANTQVSGALRAATVRRTLVDWLEHGQLQFATGGVAAPDHFSDFGLGTTSDELRFITTAATPLRRDSTVVDLYVSTPDSYDGFGTYGPPGLIASLTPTMSALQSMETAIGGTAGSGFPAASGITPGSSSGMNSPFGPATDGFTDETEVVSLDSSISAIQVDYLIAEPDSSHVWVPSSQWTPQNRAGLTLLAVRLTLQPGPTVPLQPMLALPIVVPMRTKL